MQLLKTVIITCFFLSFSLITQAQSGPNGLLAAHDVSPKGIVQDDWTFFYDADNDIYYIDFEAINLNLTKIKLISNKGNDILADDVADLPVNTIYELDCSRLTNGSYTVELHSYTEILKKEVIIK